MEEIRGRKWEGGREREKEKERKRKREREREREREKRKKGETLGESSFSTMNK